ncbi:MAG: LacI family DNA-binding transcriptional regulator [Spirochaetales bacterium]|nr:LacI family DNA-binding transcriptional regulator [Spirochaetales bacterium]
MHQNKRVSIRDVAIKANTSITTVSRVLSNPSYPVSRDLRERIQDAIKALNYTPNSAAQMLKKSFNNILGLIVRDIANSYFGEIAKGVTEQAMREGFLCFVCNTERNVEREIEYLELLWRHKVKGVILAGGGIDVRPYQSILRKQLQHGHQYGLRIVGMAPQTLEIPMVTIDYKEAARSIIQHLIGFGHTRIAMISGLSTVLTAQDHREGYQAALSSHGIPYREEFFLHGDFTEQEGYNCAQRLRVREHNITAIACGSDAMALGAIHYLNEIGIHIPREVSIVGIGDIPQSKFTVPPLTTLHVPRYEMGVRAVEMITRQEEPLPGECILFKPQLVERKSVAPPPPSN